jgi:hypothetical protein
MSPPVLECPDCHLWITMLFGNETKEEIKERISKHKERGECKFVAGN